jgi:hypothetical protein
MRKRLVSAIAALLLLCATSSVGRAEDDDAGWERVTTQLPADQYVGKWEGILIYAYRDTMFYATVYQVTIVAKKEPGFLSVQAKSYDKVSEIGRDWNSLMYTDIKPAGTVRLKIDNEQRIWDVAKKGAALRISTSYPFGGKIARAVLTNRP